MPWQKKASGPDPDGGAPPWGKLPGAAAPPAAAPAVDVAVSGALPPSVSVSVQQGAADAARAAVDAGEAPPPPVAAQGHPLGGINGLGERRVPGAPAAAAPAPAPAPAAAAATAGGALTPIISFLDKEAGELDPFASTSDAK